MELNKEFFQLLNPVDNTKDYKYLLKLVKTDSTPRNTIIGSDDLDEVLNYVSEVMAEHQIDPNRHKVYFPLGDRFEKGGVVLTLNFEI